MKSHLISYHAMDKIIRKASNNSLRVSDDAKEALAEILEQKAAKIALEAKKMAEHAGRRTILKKDIDLAVNHSN